MTIEILPRHFVEKPWGQAGLPAAFGARAGKIGEIWFDRPDAPLPLLCKWLFTSEKLSVQVHPDDAQAQARGHPCGKEECWIVTEAAPDARLGIGLNQPLSPAQLRAAAVSGEIEQLLDWKPVNAGDWFHITPGTIHAIGAGVRLVEIQQNCDITYRLYDYGRPRELHLDDAVAVSRAAPFGGACGRLEVGPGLTEVVQGPFFNLRLARGAIDLDGLGDGAFYLIPISGAYVCDGTVLEPGNVGLGQGQRLHPQSADAAMIIAEAVV